MAKASTSPDLATALTAHFGETEGQVARIDSVVEMLEFKLERTKCVAMEGLVEEDAEAIKEIEKSAVRDAGLINASQKIELPSGPEHLDPALTRAFLVSVSLPR